LFAECAGESQRSSCAHTHMYTHAYTHTYIVNPRWVKLSAGGVKTVAMSSRVAGGRQSSP